MKKDFFENPTVEVVLFSANDILTASVGNGNPPIEGEEDEL